MGALLPISEFTAADLGVIAVRAALERAFGEAPQERVPGVSAAQETEAGTHGRPSPDLGVYGSGPGSHRRAGGAGTRVWRGAAGARAGSERSARNRGGDTWAPFSRSRSLRQRTWESSPCGRRWNARLARRRRSACRE